MIDARFLPGAGTQGVAPSQWKFDTADWWLEEHGLIMRPGAGLLVVHPTGTLTHCLVLRMQEPQPRGTRCELPILKMLAIARSSLRASGEVFFLLTMTYMEVGKPPK